MPWLKPNVTKDQVRTIAREVFDVIVEGESIREFPSYSDRNFYLRATEKNNNCQEFVLKVIDSDQTKDVDLLKGTDAMMMHLREHNIPCPKPLPTINGEFLEIREFDEVFNSELSKRRKRNVIKHAVRLYNFLPGKTMNELSNYGNELFYKVGCFVAKVAFALKDFKNEAIESRQFTWDLYHFSESIHLAENLKTPEQRKIIDDLIKLHVTKVAPQLDSLPKQILHNDMNEMNLLFEKISDDEYNISGLIDFGDVTYSCRVFEIAIAACYMATTQEKNIIEAAAYTVAGFQQHFPLTEPENNLIMDLIQIRLCQLICYGVATALEHPDNAEYILYFVKRSWKVLDAFKKITVDTFNDLWRKAMQSKQ